MNPVPAAAPRYRVFRHLRHAMNTSIICLFKHLPFVKGVGQVIALATASIRTFLALVVAIRAVQVYTYGM